MIVRFGKIMRSLRDDTSGVSMLEFALAMPVMLTLGLYGTELAYMATIDMQVSQIAMTVADNASRLGQTDNSAVTPTVTETQVDSVMIGALKEGTGFDFEANGRIVLSSLEQDSSTGRQYIHWQRCQGDLDAESAYGEEDAGRTGDKLDGLGPSGSLITAQSGSAVMFVEVFYQYQPLFGDMFVGSPMFNQEAAFIIRDDRDLSGVTGSGGQSDCS